MKLTGGAEFKNVLKDLDQFEKQVQDGVVDAINETALAIESGAKRRASRFNDTSRLSSSIVAEFVSNKKMPTGNVAVGARYGPYVEFGTKSKARIPAGLEGYASQFKGGGGSFSDLLKNIRQWAKRKGIAKEAVFPIAVKIAREGVRAQPFLFPTVEEERPRFVKRLQKAIDDTN